MKRIVNIISVFLLFLSGFSVILNAATIDGDAPTVSVPTASAIEVALNDRIEEIFDNLRTQAQTEVDPYDKQDQLAQGFGDAAIMATNSASLNGYQNYSLFAIAIGGMVSLQAPSFTLNTKDAEKYADDLQEEGDIYFGAAIVPYVINAGINAKIIGLDNFYFNFKFGRSTYDVNDFEEIEEIPKLENKVTIVGVGVNYNLIGEAGVLAGFAKWRGISIGTGFYYHKNTIDMVVKLDEQSESIDQNFAGVPIQADIILDPSISMDIDSTLYIVPVEIVTSFQLLWLLNISLGAGMDITYGKSTIEIGAAGSVRVVDQTIGNLIEPAQPGSLTITNEDSDSRPHMFRPRLMAGLGLNISVVKIDVPLIYYPSSGVALGITVAVVW